MKVVLINHSDRRGGASVVTLRLTEALRDLGVDARMLVGRKETDSPFVEEAPAMRVGGHPMSFYKEHLRIFSQNGFSKKRLFMASIASDGLPLSRHPLVEAADAVILGWVNQGLLSLDEIGRIATAKPTLWVMHDQWNYTGVCHHTGNCERYTEHCGECPLMGTMAGRHDLSYRTFSRKQKLYAKAPITYVAVSEWLAGRARRSPLLGEQNVVCIPNAFPVEKFGQKPRFSRKELGLPEGKKLILFCAARIDDPGKGLPEAIALLNGLAEQGDAPEAAAVFVGTCRNPQALEELKLPFIATGAVDSEKIPSLMSHAAAVLSTSPFETLSTTMIEAQASGAVPVCYTHDGRGDIVIDGVNGFSLPHGDTAGGIRVLRNALENPIGAEELKKAADRYASHTVGRRYISLIEESLRK